MRVRYRKELLNLLDSLHLERVVVEVGSAEGRFAKELYDAGIDALYLVDIWENVPFIEGCGSFDQSWHNINYDNVRTMFSGKDNVKILKGFSHKMAQLIPDKSLSLVYIDADHTYNGCKSDIQTWWPKLVDGGIMAFHDYNDGYGVKRAVIEFAGERNINLIEEDGNPENQGAWIKKD